MSVGVHFFSPTPPGRESRWLDTDGKEFPTDSGRRFLARRMPRLLLIASDDRRLVEPLEAALTHGGCRLQVVSTTPAIQSALATARFDLLILDEALEGGRGLDLLSEKRIPERPGVSATPPVLVVLQARDDLDAAVRATRLGAVDVVAQPVPTARITDLLRSQRIASAEEISALSRDAEGDPRLRSLVGDSVAAVRLREHLRRVAAAPRSTVLIQGESGVGKELAARAVHELSTRSAHPFVALNCASLSDALFEAELFGYAPGAFTGGRAGGHAGLVSAAEGGTLFLDEIGELSAASQAKLLRFLQERSYRRVGESRERSMDARVVAATNRDLVQDVEQGRFREDLFYRLNVLSIQVAPLRERISDVVPIAEHRLRAVGMEVGKEFRGLTPEAIVRLEAHAWPGNVRELSNVIERAAVLALDDAQCTWIGAEHLQLSQPHPSVAGRLKRGRCDPDGIRLELESWGLREAEECLIRRVIERCEGNRSQAARELGIHRTTLYEKLRRYGMLEARAS